MNMQAWLDRHPIASVLTPVMVTENTKYQYGDEYKTQLENWESEVTSMVWGMIDRHCTSEQVRRALLICACKVIQNVVVTSGVPMSGYSRAISVSFTYRGLYKRTQVFHMPN